MEKEQEAEEEVRYIRGKSESYFEETNKKIEQLEKNRSALSELAIMECFPSVYSSSSSEDEVRMNVNFRHKRNETQHSADEKWACKFSASDFYKELISDNDVRPRLSERYLMKVDPWYPAQSTGEMPKKQELGQEEKVNVDNIK